MYCLSVMVPVVLIYHPSILTSWSSWKMIKNISSVTSKGLNTKTCSASLGIYLFYWFINGLVCLWNWQGLLVPFIFFQWQAFENSESFFSRTRRRAAHQYIKKKRGKDPQNVTEMMGLQLTQKPVLRDSYKKKKIVMTRNTRPEASKWLELLGRGDEILLEPRQKTIAAFLLW